MNPAAHSCSEEFLRALPEPDYKNTNAFISLFCVATPYSEI
jgi:hypothetical protein